MAILYFSPYSCAAACYLCAMKAGLIGSKITPVLVDLKEHKVTSGEASGSDFYKINPKGNVPALVLDDGTLLNESAAVLQYIADLVPASQLAPANGTNARYLLQSKLSYIGTEVQSSLNPLFHPLEDQVKTWFFEKLSSKIEYLNKVELAGKKYFVGDKFTVADSYLYILLSTAPYINFDLAKYPEVEKYFKGIAGLDFVKEAHTAMANFK
ncbi:hypothetical protein HDV01_006287 [Terramyces sp. JEL0728]|nr:hypothetical protein HDV01_006287 [Terramyces sp. JEL0728]